MDRNNLPPGIVQRIAQGDEDALAMVWRQLSPLVATYARRIVRHEQDVADVMQEVWLRLWLYAHTIPAEAALVPWLRTTTVHQSIDAMRKDARWQGRQKRFALLTAPLHPYSGDGAREVLNRLLAADVLAALPAHLRTCQHMWSVGYSLAEIAVQLRIPIGTVKSRMHAGRAMARRIAEARGRGVQIG